MSPSAGPPHYLGVGCLPARDHWWHRLLLEHPQIRTRRPEELSLGFFDQFCTRAMTSADVDAYHALFRTGDGVIDGEWTQRYIYDAWTPRLLARAAPSARILVMLPDPVRRYHGKLAIDRPGVKDNELGYWMAGMVARCRYATLLSHLFRYVDREQTLVLQYERCRQDPVTQYARTLRFLGVADDFLPQSLAQRDDGAAPPVARRVRRALGLARRRILGRTPARPPSRAAPPELWPEVRDALRADLAPEVAALPALVPDIDLALWSDFAGTGD